MKDYYNILNISASATTDEVKKAFRKLAFIYHPDKNPDTRLSIEKFAEIQEAYQILGDRKKRAEYNYSRYFQAANIAKAPLAESPEEILRSSIELRNKLAGMDPFRIDRDQLFYEISYLLSGHHMNILTNSPFSDTHTKIIQNIKESMEPLSFDYIKELIEKLQKIHQGDPFSEKELSHFLLHARIQHYWNRYQFLMALVTAILICLFIYMSGK